MAQSPACRRTHCLGTPSCTCVCRADDPIALARLLRGRRRHRRPHVLLQMVQDSPLAWCIRMRGDTEPWVTTWRSSNRARLRRRPGRRRLRVSRQNGSQEHHPVLDSFDRTVENRHLVDLITTALEAAGPERRRAAADAARQYELSTTVTMLHDFRRRRRATNSSVVTAHVSTHRHDTQHIITRSAPCSGPRTARRRRRARRGPTARPTAGSPP